MVDKETDKKWVSALSFNWLKYGLRKYAVEKIVLLVNLVGYCKKQAN